MKKIFLLIVLCFAAIVGRSQDIIVTKNGKEIKSTIIETNSEFVKFQIFSENDKQICSIKQKIKQFKKQNLPVGEQVFTLPKKEVFMIEYENGKNEIFKEKVGTGVVSNVLNFIDVNNNPEAYKLYRAGYKRYSLSKGLVGAGGGLLTFGAIAFIISSTDGKKDNTNIGASAIYMGAGCVFLATGLPLYFSAKKKMNEAFDMYTKSLKTAQNNYRLDIGITQNGAGLQLKF
ncbi:MAG TPA: hypothetical protein PKN48_06465 [Bacteroidales bacterium]|nr:hypothetical protein [Bacteroidales bacterium]